MGNRTQVMIHRCLNWNPVIVQKAMTGPPGPGTPPNESIQEAGGQEIPFEISLVTASEEEEGQTE
jgi:hypothetical protein